MGWAGAAIAESSGGVGLACSAIGVVAEELGRELVPSALVSSGLVAAEALRAQSGTPASRLPGEIATGKAIIALALDEGPHHAPDKTRAVAIRTQTGWRLGAEKRYVVDGAGADWFLVSAVAEGLPALFLVQASACTVTPLDTIDGRDVAHVSVDAEIGSEARLDGGALLIARLADLARLGLASEVIGAASRALEITVAYLETREQFGRAIGSFQALQHRAAVMHVDLVLARACVAEAWRVADLGKDDLSAAAALAKYMAGAALHKISSEMIQFHGGIGMTAEHLAGRYLKWARASEALLDGNAWLVDRYARASGY